MRAAVGDRRRALRATLNVDAGPGRDREPQSVEGEAT